MKIVITSKVLNVHVDHFLKSGSSYGTAVRALASHQCGPVSNHVMVEFVGSLLFSKRFSPSTSVFPSP